jgi:hypothetical protein
VGLLSYLSRGCDGTSDHNLDGSGDGGGAVPDGQTGVKVADGTAPFEMMVSATSAATWEAPSPEPLGNPSPSPLSTTRTVSASPAYHAVMEAKCQILRVQLDTWARIN